MNGILRITKFCITWYHLVLELGNQWFMTQVLRDKRSVRGGWDVSDWKKDEIFFKITVERDSHTALLFRMCLFCLECETHDKIHPFHKYPVFGKDESWHRLAIRQTRAESFDVRRVDWVHSIIRACRPRLVTNYDVDWLVTRGGIILVSDGVFHPFLSLFH